MTKFWNLVFTPTMRRLMGPTAAFDRLLPSERTLLYIGIILSFLTATWIANICNLRIHDIAALKQANFNLERTVEQLREPMSDDAFDQLYNAYPVQVHARKNFEKCLQQWQITTSPRTLMESCQVFDRNDDGLVTLEDFEDYLENYVRKWEDWRAQNAEAVAIVQTMLAQDCAEKPE